MPRFTLERYKGRSSRYTCPKCGAKRRFTRYIDTETGQHLSEEAGKCDRENKCGYHYPPRQFFLDNPSARPKKRGFPAPPRRVREKRPMEALATPFDTIDQGVFAQSLVATGALNEFSRFLIDRFPTNLVKDALRRYFIGTWTDGRTVFWQMDPERRLRTGKLMRYDPATGKRRKDRNPSWVHSELARRGIAGANGEFRLQQCCFGEHLLPEHLGKPVGVVESEKTAVIASMFLPDLVWLATGGCSNLHLNRIVRVAQGRRIKLFPDSSQYSKWRALAQSHPSISVSDLLERSLSEEEKALDLDLADLIVKLKSAGAN